MSELPSCGIYRTRQQLGEIPAGRLVYFHNHGNPGPGVYPPASWHQNRARFHEHGSTLASTSNFDELLEPLLAEGFYRVRAAFECCDQRCRTYESGTLVQLGYDAQANAILFVPEWRPEGFSLPERGTRVGADRLESLEPLNVPGTNVGVARVVH